MKKIFYILASAIVALGAVACQNEVDENITPNDTKEITFNVSFDESTRIAGDITNDTATFAFEGTETLKVGDAVLTQESAGVFTADAENSAKLNDLVGDTVTATVEDLGNGLKFASEEITLIAGENNITLSLACPALYFTVPAMTANVNLTIGEETIWFDKTPDVKDFFRGIEGTEVYIKHAIGTEVVKETTLRNLTNKVYNLGTLDTDMTVANVAALIDKATAGSTIKLPAGATVTGSDILTINKNITINGNGATFTSTAERAINVSGAGVEATIENLNIECTGERGVNVIQNAKSVTLTDVNITAANYAVNVAGSAAGAEIIINGGEYNGLNVVNVGGTATVTITGATINCNDNTSSESYSAIAINSNVENATINATNCTFNISGDSHIASNSGTNCSITLSPEGEVVENVAAINYGDYAYVFSTLAEAIEYANEKDNSATIVLLRDAEIAQAGTFNIDVNGHTLTVAEGYKATQNGTVWTVEVMPAVIRINNMNGWADLTITVKEGDTVLANAQAMTKEGDTNVFYYELDAEHIGKEVDYYITHSWYQTTTKDVTLDIVCEPIVLNTTYLQPADWDVDSARFAAYCYGDGAVWYDAKYAFTTDGKKVFEVELPADKNFTNIIWGRMNGAAAENKWDNRWNQTSDLTLKHMCYCISDAWDQTKLTDTKWY